MSTGHSAARSRARSLFFETGREGERALSFGFESGFAPGARSARISAAGLSVSDDAGELRFGWIGSAAITVQVSKDG